MNRLIQLVVLLIICLFGCTNNKPVTLQTKATNLYFNYDEVEHFHLDVTHQAFQSITKEVRYKDLLKFLTEPIKSISDSSFFSLLYTYPFQKKLIPNTKFDELDSIFQVKKHRTDESFACIPTYRDLLIFKRAGQVIGIAKICFECRKYSIVGTKMSTDNFGQSGDFEKLAQLLNN
jgi:hypothetical protein